MSDDAGERGSTYTTVVGAHLQLRVAVHGTALALHTGSGMPAVAATACAIFFSKASPCH